VQDRLLQRDDWFPIAAIIHYNIFMRYHSFYRILATKKDWRREG
jgi:hypothetical protein